MKTARMRIPVFVSCPSTLNAQQDASAEIIHKLVQRYKLEWRALGRSDYPNKLPLREVLRMVRHCSGGIILGFTQFVAPSGIERPESTKEKHIDGPVVMPTAWNHLEAGILFNQRLPIMIFREPGIAGGVFDAGITDVFVHDMPTPAMSEESHDDLDSVFQAWAAEVRNHYYGDE